MYGRWKFLLISCSVLSNSLQPHGLQHTRPVLYFSQGLLRHVCTELVMPSNHLILCRPLLLMPSIFPSIRVFSSELALRIRWPKYWSFNFSISPSDEYSGLISFRIDWFDLLAVQGTLKNLLQHTQFKSTKISEACLNPPFLMSFAFMMTEEIEVLPASAIFIHNLARKQLSC